MAEQADRRAMILQTLAELCGSEEFPEVKSITANEDLTCFEVTLTCEAVTIGAFSLAPMLEMYARSFRMLQGLGEARCAVRYLNAAGEIIEES